MSAYQPFWLRKTLAEMTAAEWESLCDGCGKCCLHKLEDEDTDEVWYTRVACRLLDADSCRCSDYPNRLQQVPGCLQLSAADVSALDWLPVTCAYRLLDEGQPLPEWHPLLTGDPDSVHKASMSVRGLTVSETSVAVDDYEEHIIRWMT